MKKILKTIVLATLPFLLYVLCFFAIIGAIIAAIKQNDSSNIVGINTLDGNAAIIYKFYKEKGEDDLHIAARLGNMYQESHLEPGSIEASNGEGVGICQWSFGRKTQFLNYATQMGRMWNEIMVQLEFSWMEDDLTANQQCGGVADYQWILSSYSKDDFNAAKTIEEATTIYCYGFERCGRSEEQSMLNTVRIPKAKEYYAQMKSGTIGSIAAGEAAAVPLEERMQWLFPQGVPNTAAGLQPYMVTIQVPVNNADGNPTEYSLTVHRNLADEIMAIFKEMQAAGFKTVELAGYGYRPMASGTGSLSHHSYGVAIDINWTANPAVYWGYSPDPNSPYYIDQKIVEIWKKHGFYWGGDWSSRFYDPMHMTYTDH